MKQIRSAKKIAEALECYRLNIDPMNCKKKSCPYNNNDPEVGYYCCGNNLLYDASRKLLYQDEKIKKLEKKLDFVWTGRRSR